MSLQSSPERRPLEYNSSKMARSRRPSGVALLGALTRVLSCSGVRMLAGKGLVLWSGGRWAAGLVKMRRRWWSQPRKRLTAQILQQRAVKIGFGVFGGQTEEFERVNVFEELGRLRMQFSQHG